MLFSAGYGIVPTLSATTGANSRNREISVSPRSGSPAQQPTMSANTSPCRSCGMNGSGGAIWNAGKPPSCSGASPIMSRNPRDDGCRVGHLEQHRSAVDRRHRRQLELQRGHHTEVATATAQRPEQVLVLLLAGDQELPVRGHHVGRDQVVAGQPETAIQVPDPAAEREPADTGGRDDAAGRRQPEGVRGCVEVAPGRAAAGPRGPADRVHPDVAHPAQVGDNAIVDRCRTRARCAIRRGPPGPAGSSAR